MYIKNHRLVLVILSITILNSCCHTYNKGAVVEQLSPCIITPPDSTVTNKERYQKLGLELGALAHSEFNASTKQQIKTIYQKISEKNISCQMLLQLGACIAVEGQISNTEYFSLVDIKSSCNQTEVATASVRNGTTQSVYIQIADESQRNISRAVQLELADKGFNVPGIENVGKKGAGIPKLSQVRYYYSEQFNDAKLVKDALVKNGINNVLLSPMYYRSDKKPIEHSPIEVWLNNNPKGDI